MLAITTLGCSMLIHFVFLWTSLSNWCQKLIKHWTKPAPPSLVVGLLSDLARSRTNLVVENALLRQQLIVLNRQVSDLTLPITTVSSSFYSPAVPGFGNKRFTFFNLTHSCIGIESCFVSIGGGNRRASRTTPSFQLRPSRSSERWLMKITCGVRSGFGVNY